MRYSSMRSVSPVRRNHRCVRKGAACTHLAKPRRAKERHNRAGAFEDSRRWGPSQDGTGLPSHHPANDAPAHKAEGLATPPNAQPRGDSTVLLHGSTPPFDASCVRFVSALESSGAV